MSEDAERMLACSPYVGGGAGKFVPPEVRLNALESGIWGWLASGWTRMRDDGILVYWHPEAEDWVPFTRSLHDYYLHYWEGMRHWFDA